MNRELFINKEVEIRFFFILASALMLLVITSFILNSRVERGDISTPTHITEREFPKIEIEAKSAYVLDIRTGEKLYEKNGEGKLPLASLTKIMSAIVASDIAPSYGMVNVTREALSTYGDSGLRSGEKWRLRDILDFFLITSSNDGIRAVAMALGSADKTLTTPSQAVRRFVDKMNEKTAELGLKETHFWNETGLDESEALAGAYGSAKDVAALIAYALRHYPDALEATRETETEIFSLDQTSHLARNTNSAASDIPGLLLSKTGFTNAAGGNLAFVFDPEIGRPIAVVVLGSSTQGRFGDAKKLVEATLRHLTGDEENEGVNSQ